MTIQTYILIDDDSNGEAPAEQYTDEIAAAFEGGLKIIARKPESLAGVLELIAAERPNGLLLDVALTNALTAEGAPLAFDGITLAQRIRTLQTRALSSEGGLPEFPLIRFSKKDVIREYVSGDTTSDDLFDEMIDKHEALDAPLDAARRIHSLADDYPKICTYARGDQSDATLADLLGVTADFLERQDARVLLGLRRAEAPAHLLSRHLLSALLGRPGPLIAETLLAVRLGVDASGSADWAPLKAKLEGAAYVGAFRAGYPRWWTALVLDWWSETIDSDRPPNRLGAEERVKALREKTGLAALSAIKDDPDSPGSKFWHLCSRSKRPVDPAFGFPLMPVWGQESWQDSDYLCLEEARRDSRNPRLRPSERSRLSALNASAPTT